MKQTAIEFLESKIFGDEIFSLSKVIEQAKEMEKQQIIDFAYYFRHEEVTKKELEQYYSKTYENKENI